MSNCKRPAVARQLCRSHYEKGRRSGQLPLLVAPTVPGRLSAQLVRTDTGCMEWTGARKSKGYGTMSVNNKPVATHRLAWELANGPIPDGLCVLHRCDNPPCCNVDHLFLGTRADNNADMIAKGRDACGEWQRSVTHCRKGHEYAGENLYMRPDGRRICRACAREASKRHDAIHRPPHPAPPKTHCKHGHPFDEANTSLSKRGKRVCLACARASTARYLARLKAEGRSA